MLEFLKGLFGKRWNPGANGRSAGIYAKDGFLLVHSHRETTDGVELAGREVIRVEAPYDPSVIGRAVRSALAAYETRVPHPRDWKGVGKEFLEACGVRSWKELANGARNCLVREESDGSIRFSPTKNGGQKGPGKGFHPLDSGGRTVRADANDAELGEAAVATLLECR